MHGRIIFLLEEPSMRVLLDAWLPRLFPGWAAGEHFLCIAHEGKSDLDRSIPRKLVAWGIPQDRFVIVRDNDNRQPHLAVERAEHIQYICAGFGVNRAGRLIGQ